MIKKIIIASLAISLVVCLCNTYGTPESCAADTTCAWKPDTTKDTCSNKDIGCGKKDKTTCTGDCLYQDVAAANCDVSTTCNVTDPTICATFGSICQYTAGKDVCSHKSNYGCSAILNQTTCAGKAFCQQNKSCTSTAQATCQAYSAADCKANSATCKYTERRKGGCYPNKLYCYGDCSDSTYCTFTNTFNKCDDIYSVNCSGETPESCAAPPYADECYYDSDPSRDNCYHKDQGCKAILTEAGCDANKKCEKDMDSSCEPKDGVCSIITDNVACDALTQCVYLDTDYSCDALVPASTCASHTDSASCSKDSSCSYVFSSCYDGPDPGCASKDIPTCTAASDTCEKTTLPGTCGDKPGVCAGYHDQPTCTGSHCKWTPATTTAGCTNKVSCGGKDKTTCGSDTTHCSWVSGGFCESKTFDAIETASTFGAITQISMVALGALLI